MNLYNSSLTFQVIPDKISLKSFLIDISNQKSEKPINTLPTFKAPSPL